MITKPHYAVAAYRLNEDTGGWIGISDQESRGERSLIVPIESTVQIGISPEQLNRETGGPLDLHRAQLVENRTFPVATAVNLKEEATARALVGKGSGQVRPSADKEHLYNALVANDDTS